MRGFRFFRRQRPISLNRMRRLLQIGTLLMLIASFVPLLEWFDRWDAPGLSNDTEYAVFALVLMICLVLLVGKLISSRALALPLVMASTVWRPDRAEGMASEPAGLFAVPPLLLLPLRI
jgi:hypothetical protein